MSEEQKENVVTSDQVAPKAAPKKTQKKIIKKEDDIESISKTGKVLIYFESGTAYLTPSGVRFSREDKRMAEIDAEEANSLLRLPNFRLPSDEEKEFYYNNLEA
jgi:predicted ribosome-associated RNA-binding protein Tma20